MSYRIVPIPVDFNDPEGPFELTVKKGKAELRFVDWQARPVSLTFHNVCRAAMFSANDFRGLPVAKLVELLQSPELAHLRKSGLVGAEEELHHFVVSSNEEDWADLSAGQSLLKP